MHMSNLVFLKDILGALFFERHPADSGCHGMNILGQLK